MSEQDVHDELEEIGDPGASVEAPEADLAEQRSVITPDTATPGYAVPPAPVPHEADEADAVEQAIVVPDEDDEYR